MDILTSFTPLLLWGSASLLTMWALPKSYHTRLCILPPVLLLTFSSLLTTNNISWMAPGAGTTLGSVLVFYLPYSGKLLLIDPQPSSLTWLARYKIWNNPRNLSFAPSGQPPQSSPSSKSTRLGFLVSRLFKSFILYLIDTYVLKRWILPLSLMGVSASDFSPQMETILMLSGRQVLLRTVISLQWIWSAYFFLTFYHSLISVLFVSVLRFDSPDEWPVLFGSLGRDGYTLRRFWGKFWHSLTIPTYSTYAKAGAQSVGLKGRTAEKIAVAGVIFLMSGLSHALSGWAMGDYALDRDVLFFVVNFFVCAFEVAISKTWPGRKMKALPQVVKRALGLGYVLGFFFLVAPTWMYPKIYPTLVQVMPKFEINL